MDTLDKFFHKDRHLKQHKKRDGFCTCFDPHHLAPIFFEVDETEQTTRVKVHCAFCGCFKHWMSECDYLQLMWERKLLRGQLTTF